MRIHSTRVEWLRQDELVAILGIETHHRRELVEGRMFQRILRITIWLLVVELQVQIAYGKKETLAEGTFATRLGFAFGDPRASVRIDSLGESDSGWEDFPPGGLHASSDIREAMNRPLLPHEVFPECFPWWIRQEKGKKNGE